MKASTKVCGRCEKHLPLSQYYKQGNTKDKKSNYCKRCKSEYQKERTIILKNENLAMYLLKKSCYAAFERGKATCMRKGYEKVRCGYDNVSNFFNALCDVEIFIKEWIAQTDVYIQSNNNYRYRPTIDRIDSKLGYVLSNIQMLPQYLNVSKGKSK